MEKFSFHPISGKVKKGNTFGTSVYTTSSRLSFWGNTNMVNLLSI